MAVASLLMTQLNPTVEVSDVKTAISEAVTNAIIHGYENQIQGFHPLQDWGQDHSGSKVIDLESDCLI